MADPYLQNANEGLARAASQEILYQWNKFESFPQLPFAAFLGQCDERANGDDWIIVRANQASPPRQGKLVSAHNPSGRSVTVATGKPYKSGDNSIVVNVASGGAAILADHFVDGIISYNNGLVNRIMGHEALPASGGELTISLEYKWLTDLAAGQTLNLEVSKWGGVQVASDAGIGCIGWSPIDATSLHYHWIKKAGDIKVMNSTASIIESGTALAVEDTGSVKIAGAADQQVAVANGQIPASGWGSAALTLGL